MDGNICDPLSGHFIRNEHGRVTRNSGCLAILPELNMHVEVFTSWPLKCIILQ